MAGKQMQLEDWLDDLCVRFIINLPEEDLSSVPRLCFQVEEAQWFYEDFIRPLDPHLPSMSLRTFCLRIFQHCPLLAQFSVENHTRAFEEFLEYKTRIPVRGAIMLNSAMDSAVLVKGWKKSASWGFPQGKINKDEDDLDCAIREVYEETGLDVRAAGLIPADSKPKYIELPIRNHQVRLYVFRDVPMDTNFQPQTRKEISKIQWYKLSELPTFRKKAGQTGEEQSAAPNVNKFYMVAPFIVPLKKWVGSQKKHERKALEANQYLYPQMPIEEVPTEEEGWTQAETDVPVYPQPRAPAQVPAIETLDGATQELQRLLKMQPPTQGLQHGQHTQHQQQDKGSALLSILQSKSSGPASTSQQQTAQTPHTPLDQLFAQAAQPRNPHHHTNQHGRAVDMQYQGPPPFTMAQPHMPQHQPFHQQMPPQHQQYGNAYNAPPQKYYSSSQADLVHPQPLPPQVQRSVFNKSAFQDGTAPAQSHGREPSQNMPQWAAQAQQSQQPKQFAGQPQPSHQQNKSVQLNGQSMALLNAFKRSEPAAAGPGAEAPAVSQQTVTTVQQQHQQQHYHPSQGGHEVSTQIYTEAKVLQQSPTELAGSGVPPPATEHRSALLGMFKKADSQVPSGTSPSAAAASQSGASPSATHSHLSQHSSNLLAQLQGRAPQQQRAPIQSQAQAHPMPSQHGDMDASSQLLMKHLSIQSQSAQPSQSPVEVPATSVPAAQSIRILQRGQPAPPAHLSAMSASSASASPYAAHAQAAAQPFTNSPGSQHIPMPPHTQPQPQPQPSDMTNRGQALPPNQKQQLLSLFGKQQAPPAAAHAAATTPQLANQNQPMVPQPSARYVPHDPAIQSTGSSKRGSETPMSPAEQTFLLDYLQSVTNGASR